MQRILYLVTFLMLAATAQAGDDGLYPDAIDPNASFLRVISQDQAAVTIAGKTRQLGAQGLSGFHILKAGRTEVTWPSGQTWVDLQPGRHASLLIGDGGQAVLRDDPIENHPAKADVTLINGSDVAELTLFVPQAKANVFTSLGPDKMETRALRAPLNLDFEFRDGARTLAMLSEVSLVRKSGVTFLLLGSAGDYTAVVLPNRYER